MNNNGLLIKPKTLFQSQIPILHSTKPHHSFFLTHLPNHKSLSFHLKFPSGSSLFASKTTPTTKSSNIDEQFDDDEFDEDFEEDEDDDDDIIVPLRNMREWTKNKPLGFGEGKVYDTSMEDKLLEELEQSRVAQIANINNLKKNPQHGNPKPKITKQKVPDMVPNGTRVRLVHLPKKKNIHRDLQAAFKPFSGIVNIIPAVSGNEKTREPVCKGLAYVDFKSEKEANRFVDTFSTQPMTFGKVQKQIKCELMKPSLSNPDSVKPPVHKTEKSLPIVNPTAAVNLTSIIVPETQSDPYVEVAAFDNLNNGDDDLVSETDDDLVSETDDDVEQVDNVVEEKHKPEAGSESSQKQKKVGEKGKKKTSAKKKVEKTPKLNIPGSAANKLKMKDKALLSGVFSKYGEKSTMAAEVVAD